MAIVVVESVGTVVSVACGGGFTIPFSTKHAWVGMEESLGYLEGT